ncbi:MAG: hypothetical protein II655_08330, partial [Thermoguttaceae bacterium]|nr:hypothetical protein [Thermoguttaceae bacterium]
VPGVPLIGPKFASELLNAYGSLDAALDAAQHKTGKRFENLRKHRDDALLSRRLVALRDDVPLELDWNAAALGGIDPDRLRALFQYWNFRSLLGKIDALAAEFGTAVAPPSELFEQMEARKRGGGAILPLNARNAADGEPAQDRDAPLFDRFRRALYGAAINATARPPKDADDFSDFDLVAAKTFRSLDAIPMPERPAPKDDRAVEIVDSRDKLDALVRRLDAAEFVALAAITREEPESGRTRARFATLCGLALAVDPRRAYYAPLVGGEVPRDAMLAALRPRLEDGALAKIGFEFKYDAVALLDVGVRLRGLAFDVALADYLARSGETRRGRADLAAEYLSETPFDVKSATGVGQKRVPLDSLSLATLAEYAADAVLVPLNCAPILREKLNETPELKRLYVDLELPIVETLAEMERNGVAINPDTFRRVAADVEKDQTRLEKEIRAIAAQCDPDPGFAAAMNLNSTKQLQRLLFDDLKLRVVKKTKTGPSVDAEVLEELSYEHEAPAKIVALRKLVKLRNTYLEPLPQQTAPGSNRICATFNQSATATGRLSSSDPNLQNIPARSDYGSLVRAGFIPDASLGFDALVSCDYSQIELRVLAHFSGDAELKEAFDSDLDVHASVASRIFNVPQDQVDSDMRRKAKAVNFGLIYGQTSFGLAKSINVAPADAAKYIDAFFDAHPGTLAFFDRVLEDCARRGYVETILGRRRALVGVRGARGRKTLNFPERAAINAVVQGSAADVM